MLRSEEHDWLEDWIDRWGTRITQLAFQLTRDRDMAQDVAQEAFMRLYLQHRDYPDRPLTVAWLMTVTKNFVRDMGRRHIPTLSLGSHKSPYWNRLKRKPPYVWPSTRSSTTYWHEIKNVSGYSIMQITRYPKLLR